MPARLKERIAGLKIKHDGTYNSGGYLRQGVTATDDPMTSPGAVHPLVCTHPDTGRRMLYLGRRRNAYLVGLELAESEALLDELWSFVDRPEFAWEHAWRVGDLVLWDNRCTMHRRDAFDPNSAGSCTAPRSRASSGLPEHRKPLGLARRRPELPIDKTANVPNDGHKLPRSLRAVVSAVPQKAAAKFGRRRGS